jgi:Subtilase family
MSNEPAASKQAVSHRSILALTACGLLVALSCIGAPDDAAARGGGGGGGGGRMGGGRSFGGAHNGNSGMGHSSTNTNRTTTNRNTGTNTSNTGNATTGSKTTNTTNSAATYNGNNANASGANTSGANASGANAGSKGTNAPGTTGNPTVGNSNATTSGGTAGTRTTTGSGTGNTSTANTGGTGAGSTTANAPTTGGNTTGGGSRGTGTTVSTDPGRGVPVLPVAVGVGRGGPGSPLPPNLPPNLPPPGSTFASAPRGVPINFGGTGVPPRGEQRFVPNEVVMEFSSTTTPQAIDQLARRYNLALIEQQSFPLIGTTVYRWHINGNRSVADTVGGVESTRGVARAQPNYVFALQDDGVKDEAVKADAAQSETAKAEPEAPPTAAGKAAKAIGDSAQYVLGKLEVEEAHRLATCKNIPIAVIDSEIDGSHPDLDGTIAKSFDPLGGDKIPHDHGTAMAGAIAAHGKLSGIAAGPQLLAARAFDNNAGGAKGTSFAIYKSLQWAADNGARVVNMSFAGPVDSELHRFLVAAHDKGIVLVAAAGNAGPKAAPMYPAADPDVIAVTATDSNDGLFAMANRGTYIAVAAPGVEILALAPGDAYQLTTGTSVAAAHVSGIAAMLLEEKPSLTPDQVRSIIMATAKHLGTGGDDADFGAGLADALRAVTALTGGAPAAREDAEQAKQ